MIGSKPMDPSERSISSSPHRFLPPPSSECHFSQLFPLVHRYPTDFGFAWNRYCRAAIGVMITYSETYPCRLHNAILQLSDRWLTFSEKILIYLKIFSNFLSCKGFLMLFLGACCAQNESIQKELSFSFFFLFWDRS